jgi:hypothetical protein
LKPPRPASPKAGRGASEPLKLSQAAVRTPFNAKAVPIQKLMYFQMFRIFDSVPEPGNNLLLTILPRQNFPTRGAKERFR